MYKVIAISLLIFMACSNSQKVVNTISATAPIIIYKTSGDFKNNVPILLNDGKDKVIAYPAPSDVIRNGKLTKPISLKNGYLLDIRGISSKVAFTRYTYEEYSKMESAPGLDELMDNVLENTPVLEMYECRDQVDGEITIGKLNEIIRSNFKGCEKLY